MTGINRVLVTGGAGYIGSHTTHMLSEKGYDVLVYDRLYEGKTRKGNAIHLPAVPLIVGDLSDKNLLEGTIRMFKPDAVMHFAGSIEVNESMKNPGKYYKNNLINGIDLVKAMLNNGVDKIVFSSTAAVYGQPKTTPITEHTPKEPTNNYGLTKLLFERYLNSCESIKKVCLRYFNAAGAGYYIGEDHNPETHLIPLVLKTALGQNDKIKVYGTDYDTPDGTCIRDYVHVLDLAEAHILALDVVNSGRSETYNLGTGNGNSVLEVIRTAENITGREIKKEFWGRREGDPAILVADPKKIHDELGWRAKKDLAEIIESAWEWHLENPKRVTCS